MGDTVQLGVQWRGREVFEQCTRDLGVDNSARGVRLSRTVMIQDERGRTHIGNRQELGGGEMAMKQFLLSRADLADGRLYFYGEAELVTVNDVAVKRISTLRSTGWRVARVPGSLLREGLNEVIFWGKGFLLVEDSLYPDRSAVSRDGMLSWDFDSMGPQGMNDGEFLVRLRLERYPTEAIITSPPVDLARLAAEEGVRLEPAEIWFGVVADFDAPEGTSVDLEMRLSGEDGWSTWYPAEEACVDDELPRLLQWRAVLRSDSGDATPVLHSLDLQVELLLREEGTPGALVASSPVGPRGSHRFAHQQPTDRLKRLSSQYDLPQVIADEESEFARLVALRDWCRHTAPRGWDMGRTDWCPPWDALVILETNQDPRALCMCTHYSTVFVQTAVALGWIARHVILDHHCVAEVWCNELRKWVLMDTGNSHDPERNCHFEHEGVPLNALEIQRLWRAGRSDEVWSVYRNRRRLRADRIKPETQCALENWRRFAVALRNNHLDTPFPGELTQGHGEYFCDAYLWYEERPVPKQSPEYGLTSDREADFYWPVNETSIEVHSTDSPYEFAVELNTDAPNLKGFEVRMDGGRWRRAEAEFTWRPRAGERSIEARCVNVFGVRGPAARVDLAEE